MRLSTAQHKTIFIFALLCLVIGVTIALSVAGQDAEEHRSYYEWYEDANWLFENTQYAEAYEIYTQLAAVYEDSYALQLKMTVCALQMEMWAEAVEHTRRTIELYPRLARDEDIMDALSYSLRELGEDEAAEMIWDYYMSVVPGRRGSG